MDTMDPASTAPEGVPAEHAAADGSAASAAAPAGDAEATERFEAKVLRSFIRDGRLVSIPSRERRRLVVYRFLRDMVFTEDRAYPEREVNQRLALFHPDVATIRRGMVDAGLVRRASGEYRRT